MMGISRLATPFETQALRHLVGFGLLGVGCVGCMISSRAQLPNTPQKLQHVKTTCHIAKFYFLFMLLLMQCKPRSKAPCYL